MILIDANNLTELNDLEPIYNPVVDGSAWYHANDVWACIDNTETVIGNNFKDSLEMFKSLGYEPCENDDTNLVVSKKVYNKDGTIDVYDIFFDHDHFEKILNAADDCWLNEEEMLACVLWSKGF